MWNQKGGGILGKLPLRGAPVFAKLEFFEFCIPLIRFALKDNLADTPQPTGEKTGKNAPALTSTIQRAKKIISVWNQQHSGFGEVRRKWECPLKSVKRVYMENNVYKNDETGMWFGISEMTLIREKSKYEKRAPIKTGMWFIINKMSIWAQPAKGRFYLPVTSATKTPERSECADFAGKPRFFEGSVARAGDALAPRLARPVQGAHSKRHSRNERREAGDGRQAFALAKRPGDSDLSSRASLLTRVLSPVSRFLSLASRLPSLTACLLPSRLLPLVSCHLPLATCHLLLCNPLPERRIEPARKRPDASPLPQGRYSCRLGVGRESARGGRMPAGEETA